MRVERMINGSGDMVINRSGDVMISGSWWGYNDKWKLGYDNKWEWGYDDKCILSPDDVIHQWYLQGSKFGYLPCGLLTAQQSCVSAQSRAVT